MKDAIVFVYRDDNCIEALYTQKYDEIVELIITSSDNYALDSSVNAGIFNIVKAEIGGKMNTVSSEQVKIKTSIDRKTKHLIDAYKNDKKLLIDDIINDNLPFSESIYFVGRANFFLTRIYNNKTGKLFTFDPDTNIASEVIDNDTVFEFQSGNMPRVKKYNDDYKKSDDYIKICAPTSTKNAIRMSMSNSKVKKHVRHINQAMTPGKLFNFYVFGELNAHSRLREDDDTRFFIVNPFAIWQ